MDKKQVGKMVGAGMLAGTAAMAVTSSMTDKNTKKSWNVQERLQNIMMFLIRNWIFLLFLRQVTVPY